RTRVDGNVANSVVTVFGNGHINGSVGGNVVTIFGNLRLGPKAIVQGQTVSLFGSYERNPSAVVQGGTVRLMSGIFHFTDALQGWGEHCLLFGRLLAPRLDVLWAWGVALGLLAIYLLVAALFRDGLRHCVRTLEEHPGPSILTALAMVLLTPILMLVLMVALTVTVVGIIFVPLLWIGLLCAGIFGRV
ncbi:RDD domain-containing protein, partial [mine drainage metagenome]